ncbi:peroxisomal fatty acid beta-oxidation multifunctional protein-like [Lolium rigidum]|uniref:peroxisomal fatty acid beta-oxidation multifunctional protein-like n=1 Tax=Lolium rigidum TaxID=89674 RepID=UPI001F5DC0CD|nr:peroxisomal fatty acid beta-oxidation multifunctional protein-like [Lolium rigidum]
MADTLLLPSPPSLLSPINRPPRVSRRSQPMAASIRVTMEVGADGVALITIFNPLFELDPKIILGLKEKYAEAIDRDDVKAIVLTGSAGNFCGGFNINIFRKIHETGDTSFIPDASVELVSNMIEDGKKPSVAAVQGLAACGGLELTMGCHARIATPEAQLGLPDLSLGFIPGFGGTQRLPRLVGLPKAIEIMLQSKFIMAKEAKECGLIDELCSHDELIKVSRFWALEIANCRKPWIRSLVRTDRLGSLSEARALLSMERHKTNRVAANMPQHRACLDVIEEGILRGGHAGVVKEAKVFKELVLSKTSRALVHLFLAECSTTKVPGVTDIRLKPRKITKVAVIGGGLMGSGIATSLLVGNLSVVLKEVDPGSLQRGQKTIAGNLEGLVRRGSLTKDKMSKAISLLKCSLNYSDFSDVDMVIEADIEKDPLAKQLIFSDIEKICPSNCVFATNLSTIDLKLVGEKKKFQDRIIGAHFFSPAHIVTLLEIVRTEKTSPQAILDLITLGRTMKKFPVVVRNCTGFAVNRTFSPYAEGAQLLVSLGIDLFRIDRVISNFGMPMGPFQLQDVAGYGVVLSVKDLYAAASGTQNLNSGIVDLTNEDGRPLGAQNFNSGLVDLMNDHGRQGKRYGRGYYLYDKGGKPKPDLSVQRVIDEYRTQAKTMPGGKPVALSDQDILEMIFFPVVNEAYRVVQENVVIRASDLDTASVHGMGFPKYRGGLMFWADTVGASYIHSKLSKWAETYGDFFKPSSYLEEIAKSGLSLMPGDATIMGDATNMDDGDTRAASLPYHAIFDILSRVPLKSVCRFRCVSKEWCDLISSHFFAAAHRSHQGPLLIDAGSFEEEEPAGGRDMRLMDMEGNIVRVIKGAGGYGMMCNTSLDELICVSGPICGGIQVVDPATGEVLKTCPQVDVVDHDAYPFVAVRYYYLFGFGRATPSGEYKMVRLVGGGTCEVFTLGDDDRGWRIAQPPPSILVSDQGPPIAIDGVLYFMEGGVSDNLICFDLESEEWKPDVIIGPRMSDHEEAGWERLRRPLPIRITELNGSLCMVQPVLYDIFPRRFDPNGPFSNIWILDKSDKRTWSKEYKILIAPRACCYMPLWRRADGKLLLHCSFDGGQSLVLQIYDPGTGTCSDMVGQPGNLAGRIGLCSFRFRKSKIFRPFWSVSHFFL